MYNRPMLLVPVVSMMMMMLVMMMMMLVRYSTLVTPPTAPGPQSPGGDGGLDVSVTVSMQSSARPHWIRS